MDSFPELRIPVLSSGESIFHLCTLFPLNQGIEILLQWKIPLFVTEIVRVAGLGTVNIGEIPEIESSIDQFSFGDLDFSVGIQFGQYSPVFPQDTIDATDVVDRILIGPVIEFGPALV
mgnify:CR=1 FL=1